MAQHIGDISDIDVVSDGHYKVIVDPMSESKVREFTVDGKLGIFVLTPDRKTTTVCGLVERHGMEGDYYGRKEVYYTRSLGVVKDDAYRARIDEAVRRRGGFGKTNII